MKILSVRTPVAAESEAKLGRGASPASYGVLVPKLPIYHQTRSLMRELSKREKKNDSSPSPSVECGRESSAESTPDTRGKEEMCKEKGKGDPHLTMRAKGQAASGLFQIQF